jgi:FK506-binding protein 1
MGVTKNVLRSGNGVDRPVKGDDVIIEYRGCLYDASAANNYYMGKQYACFFPVPTAEEPFQMLTD